MTFVKKATETGKHTLSEAALPIPGKAWQNAAGQRETTAPLRRLPPGLSIGDELGEPIYYDPDRKILNYRGFMCQASYNYLHKLSHDPEYETAIDLLYMGSAAGGGKRTWHWAIILAAILVVAAGSWAGWLWLR